MITESYLTRFLIESNKIEGITEFDIESEMTAARIFLNKKRITEHDLENFVSIIQEDAQLRGEPSIPGVQVGGRVAPNSWPEVLIALDKILRDANYLVDPWRIHCEYEHLHPFTDGNGRSGRMLWLWMVQDSLTGNSILFLQAFYYDTLSNVRKPLAHA